MLETRRCVRCMTRDATAWAGYVTRGKVEIHAGWCSVCQPISTKLAAWRGHWRRKMGKRSLHEHSHMRPAEDREPRRSKPPTP
jgi:hypothetical protein